jgi:hypothetical protein
MADAIEEEVIFGGRVAIWRCRTPQMEIRALAFLFPWQGLRGEADSPLCGSGVAFSPAGETDPRRLGSPRFLDTFSAHLSERIRWACADCGWCFHVPFHAAKKSEAAGVEAALLERWPGQAWRVENIHGNEGLLTTMRTFHGVGRDAPPLPERHGPTSTNEVHAVDRPRALISAIEPRQWRAAEGISVQRRERILARDPFDYPGGRAPCFHLSPRVADKNKWARIEALPRNRVAAEERRAVSRDHIARACIQLSGRSPPPAVTTTAVTRRSRWLQASSEGIWGGDPRYPRWVSYVLKDRLDALGFLVSSRREGGIS